MADFLISNSHFVSVNSPLQNKEIFKQYRTESGDIDLYKLISEQLDKYHIAAKELFDKITYDPEYGLLIHEEITQEKYRRDRFCYPTTREFTLHIYFRVNMTWDMDYTFDVVFLHKNKPISFELMPRDIPSWSETQMQVMDKLAEIYVPQCQMHIDTYILKNKKNTIQTKK